VSHRHPAAQVAARLVVSAVAGVLLWSSFPPRPLWFLAPAGVALLVLVLRGRGVRAGFAYGYVTGLGFLVPLLPWVGIYVGPLPWLALAAFERWPWARSGSGSSWWDGDPAPPCGSPAPGSRRKPSGPGCP